MATQDAVQLPVLADRWEYDPRAVFVAGNNAQTFAGRDLQTGDEIVVKIFSDTPGGRGQERFLREARLHEELKHEAILELLGQGPTDGVDYIVTRRLRPGALWEVVRDRSRLSPAATLAIGTRIADALAYMHGRGEVHGDISPGNILLDAKEVAYLADFGLSKRIAAAPVATTGDGFGTPRFSPPREPGTRRTQEDDVFGLAAVLWFCLTGEPPSESPRARRRELPNRALRAPLTRALRWESAAMPTAEAFKDSLIKHWAKVGQDWRAMSSPQRRSRVPAAIAAGLIGLGAAGLAGQALQPKPAGAAQTTIDRGGVTLSLPSQWRRSSPPPLPAFRLREPLAAARGRAKIVVGRAPSAGPRLIANDALASLPRAARRPSPVTVGEHEALRYAAVTSFGGAVEILAFPLARNVLVIHCSGPVTTLSGVCAQASADLELRDGSMQALAPTRPLARRLRTATKRLKVERRQQRARLSTVEDQKGLSIAAGDLARANRSFASEIAALPSTAQDARALGGAVSAARQAGAAYADLSRATTDGEWSAARASVDQSEQRLESAMRQLGRLRAYGP